MSRSDPRFRVGLALTIFCALLFLLAFTLDVALSWFAGTATVKVRFPTAQGLTEHDPVHFHGVPCGRVLALAFDPVPARAADGAGVAHAETVESGATSEVSVLLTLQVPPRVRDFLRNGSHAQIEKTLTGVTVVNLLQGTGPPLEGTTVLEGTAEANLADIAGSMQSAVASLGRILADLEPIAATLRTNSSIPESVETFGRAAEEVRELAVQLQGTARDLADPIRDLTDRAGRLVDEAERGARQLPQMLAEMETSARKAGGVADDARSFLRETGPEWRAASEDLAATSANARALTAEIRRRPWRLLKSPSERDAATIDLYETADRYADGALELRRSLELVRAALARRSADAAANQALDEALRALEASVAAQATAEEMFWSRMSRITD